MFTRVSRQGLTVLLTLTAFTLLPDLALAQAASPFMTGATALQTNILAWLTPVAIILVMVLGAMAMANRMLKSLAARIVFAPKDFADAREISDELGATTVRARTVSKPLGMALERRAQRGSSQSVSEQRRPLLLPQEVKELGGEEAIVFYEGVRPIRCRKIRYFADPRFRKRLLPPPEVAVPLGRKAVEPTPAPQVATVKPEIPEAGATPNADIADRVVIREGTAEDVERIESLGPEDFALDLASVQLPDKEGPLTDGEMKAAVESFVTSVKHERGGDHGR